MTLEEAESATSQTVSQTGFPFLQNLQDRIKPSSSVQELEPSALSYGIAPEFIAKPTNDKRIKSRGHGTS